MAIERGRISRARSKRGPSSAPHSPRAIGRESRAEAIFRRGTACQALASGPARDRGSAPGAPFAMQVSSDMLPRHALHAAHRLLGTRAAPSGSCRAGSSRARCVRAREFRVRHGLVDEPHLRRLAAVEGLAGHDIVHGIAQVMRGDHRARHIAAGDDAPVDLGEAEFASSAAIARSQETSGVNAPPKHQPLTMAMVGFGRPSDAATATSRPSAGREAASRRAGPSSARKYSRRSMPAEEGTPRRRSAPGSRNDRRLSSTSSTASISSLSGGLIALRFSGG